MSSTPIDPIESETVPYWKDYSTNVVRGIIAAVCCAVFFIGIGLIHKFRWRPTTKTDKSGGFNLDDMNGSSRVLSEDGVRSRQKTGVQNLGMDISDN